MTRRPREAQIRVATEPTNERLVFVALWLMAAIVAVTMAARF
jgi:hypothetical protein